MRARIQLVRGHGAAALIAVAALTAACAAGGAEPDPLQPPTALVASAGNRAVTLTWAMEQGVGYTLYWANAAGVDAHSQSISKITSPYVHRDRENGVRVYYRLQAWDESGTSELSAEVSALPDLKATAPGAPASVIALAGDGKVSLSWGDVTAATGYTIYRDTTSGVHPANGTAIKVTTSPYDDLQVQNGVTYYYVVTATVGGAQGPPSAEVSATPQTSTSGAPTNVQATAGNGQVSLIWTPVLGASGYTVYWGTSTGVTKVTGTAVPQVTTTSYLHTGLTNGTTYHYVVTATAGGKESAESVEVNATPTSGPISLPAPINVSASGGDGKVTVSWAPVSGATSYTLYWATAAGVTKTTATAVSGATSPYLHASLTNGTTYYYAVTASNTAGESPLSTEVSATPKSGSSGHGTASGTLSSGAYGLVMLNNTTAGKGVVQLGVYTADPLGSPAGQPISGLTVAASGAVTGPLPAGSSAGTYENTTAFPLTAGTYVFTVSGTVSGKITVTVQDLSTCTLTSPTSGSSHTAGTDLKLTWSSTNSDKALIQLQDTAGTVSYPVLKPDPGGATVPGKDIPYKGALQILVSAVWSVTGSNAAIVVLGDAGVQIVLK